MKKFKKKLLSVFAIVLLLISLTPIVASLENELHRLIVGSVIGALLILCVLAVHLIDKNAKDLKPSNEIERELIRIQKEIRAK